MNAVHDRGVCSRAGAALALAAVFLSAAAAVAAQEATTGTIEGRVVDAQGLAIPGATVTVTGPQGAKAFVTDEDGGFHAPFLTPGVYDVRVELSGFRPISVDDVTVALGQRATLAPITLRVGALTETVEVVASRPAVDTTTSSTGASLQSDFLERLPTQRHVSDIVQLAPGVTDSGGAGEANPSIAGASGLENQYIIDGVNITNSGYGAIGSYSIVFGSLGSGVPFDFIEEVRVKTGGYEAEFGQATGGVVQAVTKSGANQFRGSGFGYWQPEAFVAEFTPVVLPNATRGAEAVNTRETFFSDAGVEVGGPIWQNRMFFFGAVDRQWNSTTLIAPEHFPLRDLGEISRARQAVAYSGKVTYQLNDINRFDFSVFGDPSQGELGPQRRTALLRTDLAAFSEIEYGGHNQTLRYEGVLTPTWLLSASIARATNSIEETPAVDAWSVTDATFTPERVSGGLGFYEVGNAGENLQYQAKTTYLWRDHEFRGGVLYEDIAYDNIIDRTGPPITLPDGTVTATGATVQVLPDPQFGQVYRVVRANITNVRETRQNYFSLFLQDTWRLGDRLTLKPGIRYEQQKLIGNLEDFTWDGNWAPRIGAIYDPLGNGRTKIFGNWGRYFAKIPNDLAARALSADAGVTRADYFDADLTRPIPNGVTAADTETHFLTAGLSAADFDPDSKSTYSDEWLLGVEHELFQGISLGLNYTNRRFGRVLEDVGTLPMIAYFLEDVPGSDSVEYFITNPDANTPVAGNLGVPISFEEAIHDYDAVTVTAEKRFGDGWGLQSSYRWSRLNGNFEGFFRNDNGQSDPAITSLFDFPTNDPTYTQIGGPQEGFRGDIRFLGALGAGPLPLDRPHQFKVYGTRVFPAGVTVGIGFNAQSGTPLTALAANPVYDSDGEIPETPRGAGFETVDGFSDRTPWTHSLDFHVNYRIPLFGNRSLLLLADVFNLFDTQEVLDYDNYTESSFQVPNPDFGRVIAYQPPRQLRIGARFAW
jgi:outer membrane receptor protein involved in Fe transport